MGRVELNNKELASCKDAVRQIQDEILDIDKRYQRLDYSVKDRPESSDKLEIYV